MLWFQHHSNLRHSPKLRAIELKLGEAGYARAVKLMELIAEFNGRPEAFQPTIDLKSPTTNLVYLAGEWGTTAAKAKSTLELFANVGFIDTAKWQDTVIHIPEMMELLDDWTRRKRRESGATPELHGRGSRGATE